VSASQDAYEAALERAAAHARRWLSSLPDRPVAPSATADSLLSRIGGSLPPSSSPAAEVIDALAALAEPGLMAMPSGRFFGWVIGGTLPAALAADWLVSAWDQNTAMRFPTPAATALEEAAGAWLLELLGLPGDADVGFVTGATMANFTGLAAGRRKVLAEAGWDVDTLGLAGAPKIRVLVGEERHDTLDLALRFLGLGTPTAVGVDSQGRMLPSSLDSLLASSDDAPTIVCLQAGNIHSGASDPFTECVPLARGHKAWVHVDGAFGLWAAASPSLRSLVTGCELADSWATDAHKTLNVPYDCGIAVVADRASMRGAMGIQASYLINPAAGEGPADPMQKVPELSRRARGIPVWAALRSLGRSGVVSLVDGLVANARAIASGIAAIPGAEVLNDVSFTQVSVSFGSDERTAAVTSALLSSGVAWMSGSRWRGRTVLRVSVSNWSTDAADVAASVEAVRRAAATVFRV
jgi:glutamate/tyrosine decarboxylase-like PLP-dependent enzyme